MEDIRTINEFVVNDLDGNQVPLSNYQGKVLLIVNTASKGDAYKKLRHMEHIQKQFVNRPFAVLAFPCSQFFSRERSRNEEIKDFYYIRERVPFTVFAKVKVNGNGKLPLYKWLKSKEKGPLGKAIEDNFVKFVVECDGRTVHRYNAATGWYEMSVDIQSYIEKAEAMHGKEVTAPAAAAPIGVAPIVPIATVPAQATAAEAAKPAQQMTEEKGEKVGISE